MSVNTGGPHLLLFERDQQLTALLISEFQLAGYECHTARTAVEVFDAIARYPIRLVLVNLAQAAAGRREFWVALDAQRRGRGVQVFTFRCINLAGYGPDDPEERSRNMLADLEVDGMLGVMSLVNAIRSRIPGTTTGSFSRAVLAPPTPPESAPQTRAQSAENRTQGELASASKPVAREPAAPPPSPPVVTQITSPMPSVIPSGPAGQSLSTAATTPPPARQPQPPMTVTPANPAPPGTFTEKIRAVIYPSSRSFSPRPEGDWASQNPPPMNVVSSANQAAPPPVARPVARREPAVPRPQDMLVQPTEDVAAFNRQANRPPIEDIATFDDRQVALEETTQLGRGGAEPQNAPLYADTAENILSSMQAQPATVVEDESSLAQLSRMLREQSTPLAEEAVLQPGEAFSPPSPPSPPSPSSSQTSSSLPPSPVPVRRPEEQQTRSVGEMTSQQMRSGDSAAISALPLRASPIQGLPIERESEHRPAMGAASVVREREGQATQQPRRAEVARPGNVTQPTVSVTPAVSASPAASVSPIVSPPAPTKAPTTPRLKAIEMKLERDEEASAEKQTRKDEEAIAIEASRTLIERVQASLQGSASRQPGMEIVANVALDDTLLNIVQSLPPMSSPPPQPPVLSGRATRSLGSVLLEGHLVPQQRLEVAQSIQRMLRGVDMNYQLGEILLMFKLLTPDQLLAASLVSYGLISTAQISALGRIRQELYSIGLEYDLESLLVLFRILTPEQLREVRSSWSG